MADNILYLNMPLVSLKWLFEVCLFDKGVMDDKIAMIAMRWRIFGKNVPTSNPGGLVGWRFYLDYKVLFWLDCASELSSFWKTVTLG